MSEGWIIRKPFVLVTYGTSLTTGRLSTFWPEKLQQDLLCVPEGVGPVVIHNLGKGSQNSQWGVDNAYLAAALRPSHILSEGFAINDCVDAGSGPAISQAQHILNIQAMHDAWVADNPDVDITWQTMNPVSVAGEALRPDLADYYADEVTKAAGMGDRMLNNYDDPPEVPPGVAGGWPKPMNPALTDNGDGLHPIWAGAVDTYLYPNVVFWARQRMAEFWDLDAPVP